MGYDSSIWTISRVLHIKDPGFQILPESKFLALFEYFHYLIIRMIPANIYLFKVNNRDIRKRCETCLKLTKKTTRTTCLTLNIFYSVVGFEQVNVSWDQLLLIGFFY